MLSFMLRFTLISDSYFSFSGFLAHKTPCAKIIANFISIKQLHLLKITLV